MCDEGLVIPDIPGEIGDNLKIAIEIWNSFAFLQGLASATPRFLDYYLRGGSSILDESPGNVSWEVLPTPQALNTAAGTLVYRIKHLPAFSIDLIVEVNNARKALTGPFSCADWDGSLYSAGNLQFDSAFEFINCLVTHIALGLDEALPEFCDVIARAEGDFSLKTRTSARAEVHDMMSLILFCSALPEMSYNDQVSRELIREAIAADRSRRQGSSWQNLTIESRDEYSTVTIPESGKTPLSFADLSDFKRLVLRALRKISAFSRDAAVTSVALAQLMHTEADSRLRSELAELRRLGLIGGRPRERGAWLSEFGQVITNEVDDSV